MNMRRFRHYWKTVGLGGNGKQQCRAQKISYLNPSVIVAVTKNWHFQNSIECISSCLELLCENGMRHVGVQPWTSEICHQDPNIVLFYEKLLKMAAHALHRRCIDSGSVQRLGNSLDPNVGRISSVVCDEDLEYTVEETKMMLSELVTFPDLFPKDRALYFDPHVIQIVFAAAITGKKLALKIQEVVG